MTKISLKILLAAFISGVVLFFNSDSSKGCGGQYILDDYYKIFEEQLFDLNNLKPFLVSENIFADYDIEGSVGPKLDNLKGWLLYFDNKPVIDDLDNFIYSSTEDELKSLLSLLQKNDLSKVENNWSKNSVITKSERNKLKDAIEYLIFAKQCEPYVAIPKDYWEEVKKDISAMDSLTTIAAKLYEKTSSNFFKERYAYQTIRLAHYSQQFEKTVNLYEKYFGNSKSESLIKYWSLAHCAGATRSLGNSAKANVLFARVFDKCPSRRTQSTLSFRFLSDSLFSETLKRCENNHDKVLVYTIGAYKNPGLTVDAINNIYNYEPTSQYLTLLLARAITTLERNKLPSKVNYNYKTYLEDSNYYQSLVIDSFLYKSIIKIADVKKTGNDYLWNYAAGYIASLQNQPDSAEKYFYEAKRLCPKDNLDFVRRVQIAEIVCYVNSLKQIDESTEGKLFKNLSWLKETAYLKSLHSEDAYVYMMNTLAKLYWAQGDTIKTHLCLGTSLKQNRHDSGINVIAPFNYEIATSYHIEPLEQLYHLLAETSTYYSSNEATSENWLKFLVSYYRYSLRDMYGISAKKLIAKGLFEDAHLELQKTTDEFWLQNYNETLPADPFDIQIIDNHDRDFFAEKVKTYTLVSLCKNMIELKRLAENEKDNNKSAQYYFELANGYYNITFYGNSWMASSFNTRGLLPWGYTKEQNYDFYDCSRAEENYLKAAKKTANKEFAAQCYFMAAKCEQNKFYNNMPWLPYTYYMDTVDKEYLREKMKYKNYFSVLKEKYSQTDFYQEALKECNYFNYFVKNY